MTRSRGQGIWAPPAAAGSAGPVEPAGQGAPRRVRSPAVRRALPPLLWFALILLLSTDLGSASRTGALVLRLVDLLALELSPERIAALHVLLRKAGHVAGYAVLALLVRPAVDGRSLPAWLLVAAAAAVDESLQSLTPSRTGSVADVVLDAAAAAATLAAAACLRRLWETAMNRLVASRLPLLVALLLAAGCAPSLPYRLDLGYQPPAAGPAEGRAVVVALAPTRDARALPDAAAVGRRITTEGQVEPMVAAREKAEAIVTDALHARLVALGYPVRRLPSWDGRPESLDASAGQAVLAAELLDFWTEAKSEPLKPTTIASRARIRLVLADPASRRILWTNTVESASEQDVVRFTESSATRNANEALGGAIRAMLEHADLKDRLGAIR